MPRLYTLPNAFKTISIFYQKQEAEARKTVGNFWKKI